MKRFIFFSVMLLILALIFSCSSTFANIKPSLPDINGLQDGTYRGEYSLPKSPLSAVLEVTVNNHIIIDINIIEHNCSPIGKKSETIIGKIREKQSLNVDAVSGATLSSKTLLMAVQNALQ
jgi:uncharacterized protein with FMN-binding domain